jgi:hypothetical protein
LTRETGETGETGEREEVGKEVREATREEVRAKVNNISTSARALVRVGPSVGVTDVPRE